MQYTQGQLRAAVGLSVETYRHWKKVLPVLSSHKGQSAKFHIGDLLAAAVLKQLTTLCSIKIGNLSDISHDLFRLCNTASLSELEKLTIQINLKNNSCIARSSLDKVDSPDIFIIVPLASVVSELREDLLEIQTDMDAQLSLSIEPFDSSLISKS